MKLTINETIIFLKDNEFIGGFMILIDVTTTFQINILNFGLCTSQLRSNSNHQINK